MAVAAADYYDRGGYRPNAHPVPAPPAPVPVGGHHHRNEVVPYGDRRLDVVAKPAAARSTRSGDGGAAASSAWCFSDPETKRRRRVAGYKAYAVEGKVRSSLRRGFRWIKAKCSDLIHHG